MNKYCITEGDISAELRRIQTNLAVHNFIGNGEQVGGEMVFRRDLKPQIKSQATEPRKKEIARQNKVKMLEQIMSKTFSHGGTTHIGQV